MDISRSHFIPPHGITVPTNQIILEVESAADLQRDSPLPTVREAKNGHLSVYGDLENGPSRVVLAISFREEKVPVLGRQTYYHYLDTNDILSLEDGQISLIFNGKLSATGFD